MKNLAGASDWPQPPGDGGALLHWPMGSLGHPLTPAPSLTITHDVPRTSLPQRGPGEQNTAAGVAG